MLWGAGVGNWCHLLVTELTPILVMFNTIDYVNRTAVQSSIFVLLSNSWPIFARLPFPLLLHTLRSLSSLRADVLFS